MDIKVNSEVLNRIKSEQFNTEEALLLLNETIDNELSKEEPDFELIEECTDALIELQSKEELPLNTKKIKLSRTFVRIVLVAAFIFATTLTANAAYTSATGNDIISDIVNSVSVKKDKDKKVKETTTVKETQHYSYHKTETTTKPKEITTEQETEILQTTISGKIGEKITEPEEDETEEKTTTEEPTEEETTEGSFENGIEGKIGGGD